MAGAHSHIEKVRRKAKYSVYLRGVGEGWVRGG